MVRSVRSMHGARCTTTPPRARTQSCGASSRGGRAVRVQEDMVNEGWHVVETTAGRALLGVLAKQEWWHLAQLRELQAGQELQRA